jgi:hypothetical protein
VAPEEMTWPGCLCFNDGEADRARGGSGWWKQRDSACHPRREKGGEAHADGRGKALEENTRHHCFGSAGLGDLWRPWATMDNATSVEGRDSWRYDILRRLPFPTPLLFGLGNCMIGRVMRDR